MSKEQRIGLTILRTGLAAVFIWFGYSQLTASADWIGWVPSWSVDLLNTTPEMVTRLNGAFELIAGTFLLCNVFVRPIAVLLTLHMLLITYEVGYNEVGMRDFGITMAMFALFFLTPRPAPQTEAES